MLSRDVAVDNDYQSSLKNKNDASLGVKTPKTLNDAVENSFMRSAKPYVIVAIPAFNEEIAIGSVALRSRKYADEVIVIDDGSKDRTSEIAAMAGAKVLPHLNNGGKGAAIKDAFAYAKKANADVLILIDGDGQHNPDEIPSLLAPIFNGEADIVNGSRFLANTVNNVPKYRRLGQEVLTFATNAGANMNITDTQNGFRAFSKKTFNCFSFNQNGMAIESEMLMDATHANMRIKEVPINVRYDVANGSTYNPLSHGISVLGSIISLISVRRPLIFFAIPGAMLLLIGIGGAFMTFDIFNNTRDISVFYAVITAVSVSIGTTSIFTGFILNAIQTIKISK